MLRIQGMEVYQNMSKCDKMIQQACTFDMSGSEEVERCWQLMSKFRNDTELCKIGYKNCSCWSDLKAQKKNVSACNIGMLLIAIFAPRFIMTFLHS